jgi:hypothetical protein
MFINEKKDLLKKQLQNIVSVKLKALDRKISLDYNRILSSENIFELKQTETRNLLKKSSKKIKIWNQKVKDISEEFMKTLRRPTPKLKTPEPVQENNFKYLEQYLNNEGIDNKNNEFQLIQEPGYTLKKLPVSLSRRHSRMFSDFDSKIMNGDKTGLFSNPMILQGDCSPSRQSRLLDFKRPESGDYSPSRQSRFSSMNNNMNLRLRKLKQMNFDSKRYRIELEGKNFDGLVQEISKVAGNSVLKNRPQSCAFSQEYDKDLILINSMNSPKLEKPKQIHNNKKKIVISLNKGRNNKILETESSMASMNNFTSHYNLFSLISAPEEKNMQKNIKKTNKSLKISIRKEKSPPKINSTSKARQDDIVINRANTPVEKSRFLTKVPLEIKMKYFKILKKKKGIGFAHI